MDCPEVRTMFKPYLHLELDPGAMRGIQLHLGDCSACRTSMRESRIHNDVVTPYYLAAYAHDEVPAGERVLIEEHLRFCEPCREEADAIRVSSFEMIKNLSQYQLTGVFVSQVMAHWKPHRSGEVVRMRERNLAEVIERAEAGNVFSYERHVSRFKDYAYIAAFLEVGDFQYAASVAQGIFTDGMPKFPRNLTRQDFMDWLHKQARKRAPKGAWVDAAQGEADGLSGYEGSRKLRRHKKILQIHTSFDIELQVPFLLFHVQRLGYDEIAALLELERSEVHRMLLETTLRGREILLQDDIDHPYKKRYWE